MDYVLYVIDTETTGLDILKNDIIEISICRLTDNVQKTWRLKPLNTESIEPAALKVNGHKLEDILHQTKYGKDTYKNPQDVIIEIENWVMEDNVQTDQRVLVAQNITFDKPILQQLWNKCNSADTFPFGRRVMDTMIMAFMMDYATGTLAESYSLSNLIKKYGIKNEKAHTADADVRATKELFEAQINSLSKKLKD